MKARIQNLIHRSSPRELADVKQNWSGLRSAATRLVAPALLALATLDPQLSRLLAQGTAFTYQGRLNDGGAPASGNYDLRFSVYDSPGGGLLVAGPLTNAPTGVSNGLFTATLDFGSGVFSGPARWLEIGVRTNGSAGAYQTLNPRQPLTAAPYAVTAGNLTGVVPGGSLSGTYPGAVTFNNGANVFAGNGAGLTSLNATQLIGTVSTAALGNAWQIAGNAGTGPANGNFIGTTDNQPLEFRINQSRAFRLEPGGPSAHLGNGIPTGAPNIIGGASSNSVPAGVVGAVIAGGGSTNYGGFAYLNSVSADFGAVAGGSGNQIQTNAASSFIGGGFQNQIQAIAFNANLGGYNSIIAGGLNNTIGSPYTTIGGGSYQLVGTNSNSGFIGGGYFNQIGNNSFDCTIGGGSIHSIGTNCFYSTIAGGRVNSVGNNATAAAIGGGQNNSVGAGYATVGGGFGNTSDGFWGTVAGGYGNSVVSTYATVSGGYSNTNSSYAAAIGGGQANTIQFNASYAFIGAGNGNNVAPGSGYSVIGGGITNSIQGNSGFCVLGGGFYNSIGTNAYYASLGGGASNLSGGFAATVPGGYSNTAAGQYSFAAGLQAQANHDGTFVWADAQNAPFASTTSNQFLVRAAGGVGINTNTPAGAALNVAGTVRAASFQGDGSGLFNVGAGALGNYVFAYNNTVQSVVTGNVFQDVTFGTDTQLNGWMHTASTSQYTNAQTGLYLIQFNANATTTSGNGTNVQLRATLNGTEIPGSRSVATLSALNQFVPLSRSLLTSANAGDVLTIQFTGSGTGIRLAGAAGSALTITRIQ